MNTRYVILAGLVLAATFAVAAPAAACPDLECVVPVEPVCVDQLVEEQWCDRIVAVKDPFEPCTCDPVE